MRRLIDQYLERMAKRGEADRRNGRYRRHLLTEVGMRADCLRILAIAPH